MNIRKITLLLLFSFLITGYSSGQKSPEIPKLKTIPYNTPAPPPEWALLQRHLLRTLYPAVLEFVEKYTNPDGSLIWR